MKIAFISDAAFPWPVGGVEQTERLEAEYLAKSHDVHFFSFIWKGMRREFTDKGIHYHCSHYLTDSEFYRHKRRSIREAFIFSMVAWRIFSDRFDVVQVNAFPYLHLPVVKLYCRITGAKLIMDVAEYWGRDSWKGYLGGVLGGAMSDYTNWTLSGADAYIANPGRACDGLISIGIPRRKINQFTPILDDREISAVNAPQRRGVVVYMGRLIKEKRFDRWIDAVKKASLRDRSIRGVIVGDGPEREHIRHTVSALGLSGVIELRRYYPKRRDAHRVLKGASLFLNMSEREGLSATALESIALGTPVLLPSYSPIPSIVKSMCVVRGKDSMADWILRITRSKSKRRFIRNERKLDSFRASGIPSFYRRLFRKLSIGASD